MSKDMISTATVCPQLKFNRTIRWFFSRLIWLLILSPPVVQSDDTECSDAAHVFVLGSFQSLPRADVFLQKTSNTHPQLSDYLRIYSQNVTGSASQGLRHRVIVGPVDDLTPLPFCLNQLRSLGFSTAWAIKGYPNNNHDPVSKGCPDGACIKPKSNPDKILEVNNNAPASFKKIADTDWVPEGFEELDELQETTIDLFYGGFFLTSVKSKFTSVDILIQDVDILVSKLQDLKDPSRFRELLLTPFYTNSDRICPTTSSVNCGDLTTDTVAVIFDRARLRVDLFIAPELLKTRTMQQLAFLPQSDAGFSMLDHFSMYTSGSTLGKSNYNIANTTILSYAENRLLMRSNFTDSAEFSVDTLAFAREYQGRDYQAGIFRGNAGGFVFMKDSLFAGAAIESSLITRNDLQFSLGNEIEVFLDSRSRVEIYKDGRLISTQFYDVGNQQINTSSLPGGAYDLEIKIINSAGNERTETRYFSKSSKLPPADQPLYFLQVGEEMLESDSNRILPQGTDRHFLRAGVSKRLGHSFGAGLGFSTNDSSSMVEVSAFKQGGRYELQSIFAYEDLNVSALDLKLRMRFDNGSINLSSRKIWSGLNVSEANSQIGNATLQTRVSAAWNTAYGSLNAFYRSSKAKYESESTNYGLRWSKNWASGNGGLNSSLEFSTNDGEDLVLFKLNYRLQKKSWSHIASAQYLDSGRQNNTDNSRMTGYASSNWRNSSDSANQYQIGLRADSQDQGNFETRASAKGNLGEAGLTTQYNNRLAEVNYSGSVTTSFVATKDAFGIGGERRALSGFLVSTKGNSAQASAISVVVDGSKRAKIELNSTRFIPASEYDIHEISFLAEGDALMNVDTKIYRKTFYPGNVISIDVRAKQIFVAIGRLVNPDGTPLSNALLLDIEGIAISDDEGYFQAEMASDIETIRIRKGGKECTISLGSLSSTSQVIFVGEQTCH